MSSRLETENLPILNDEFSCLIFFPPFIYFQIICVMKLRTAHLNIFQQQQHCSHFSYNVRNNFYPHCKPQRLKEIL